MMKMWKAVRADGLREVISGIIAENADQAAAEVERVLKGRPGGRHEAYLQWERDGRKLIEESTR